MSPKFSVVVASSCTAGRREKILRCVHSVLSQNVPLELIFVANGGNVTESVLANVRSLPGVHVIRLEDGHVSHARLAGIRAARGEFLSFIDDDDEFLAGALQRRIDIMGDDVDVLATNGWVRTDKDELLVEKNLAQHIARDPVGSFLNQNWFASAGPTFRLGKINARLFDMDRRYFEWTLLFFRLHAAGVVLHFDAEPSFRKFEDHGDSVSASLQYANAYVEHLDELLGSPDLMASLTRDQRSRLRRKLVAALNQRAANELSTGRRRNAWQAHVRCLRLGGLTYLPFTRKILFKF